MTMTALLRIAVRNVARHPRRTVITCAAVASAVIFMVVAAGFLDFSFWGLRRSIVYGGLGHLQILPRTADSRARLSATDVTSARASLGEEDAVSTVAVRLEFQGLASSAERTLTFSGVGVEPHAEADVRAFTMLTEGEWFSGAERVPHVLLGAGLARRLRVRARDVLSLIAFADDGTMTAADVQVGGTFETGVIEYDARTLLAPLTTARELMATGGASGIAVLLRDDDAMDPMVDRLRRRLAEHHVGARVVRWDELSPVYASVVRLYRWIFHVFFAIVTLVVVLGIANTMSMAVLERIAEVGVLRALGFGPWRVATTFVIEAATIGALGAIVGVILGAAACLALSAIGIQMPPPPGHSHGYVAQVRIVPRAFAVAAGVATISAGIAAIGPSLRCLRKEVSDALRSA